MKQIIPFLIIALIFASCSQKATPEQNQKKAEAYKLQIAKLEKKIDALNVADEAEVDKVYPVKVTPLVKDTVLRKIDYNANIIPYEQIYLAPAAPGKIVKIYVEIGDKVKKGQKLVQMDETQLIQAKLQLASLQKDYDRIKTLKESGTVAEQQYDQIKTQYEVTKTNVKYLEDNTVLYAPFSGIITGKYFEDGENYSGAPNTQAGKAAIVTLDEIDKVKAIVNVSEQYYTRINNGTQVKLHCDVFPGEIFDGKIFNIYPTIDPLTRTFKIELEAANPAFKLRPGMYSNINLILGEAETITAPAIAVLQQEGTNKHYVFINNKGVANRVDVTLGDRFNDQIEILSNEIQAGDQLITVGQSVLMDKYKVKVVK